MGRLRTGDIVAQDSESEHIGPLDTGDSISAKRVATYIWNPTGTDLYTGLKTGAYERNTGQAATLDIRLDDFTDTTLVYIGKAPIATTTATAAWQIAKLDVSSGLVKTWADGNALFDNIWDNRAALTYA